MSKYYKAEDVLAIFSEEERPLNWTDSEAEIQAENDFDNYKGMIESLPTIEVSDENELKFYYVESIDDYWIGQRLDNFYYAEWSDRLGFVWTHSRYLPWGEHVVAPDTLWKEHTYPSEPREIPFTEWIVGFKKKYGSKVSEDCISREGVYRAIITCGEVDNDLNHLYQVIENEPSVVPQVPNEDCISREFALEVISDYVNYPTEGDKTCAIKNAPSVVPTQTNANQRTQRVESVKDERIEE